MDAHASHLAKLAKLAKLATIMIGARNVPIRVMA
jgi:hypothetical protein